MSLPALAKTKRERSTRRPGLARDGLALLVALPLLAGCQTDRDPRTGGFFGGVDNLVSGGYGAFVEEKRDELEATQEESRVLEARAQEIETERDSLGRQLEHAAGELKLLHERLAAKRAELDAAKGATATERRRLEEAEGKAKLTQARLEKYRQGPAQSIEAARKEVDDLKNLIGTIGTMVSELSG